MASEQLARPLAEPPYPEKEKETRSPDLFSTYKARNQDSIIFYSSTQTRKFLHYPRKTKHCINNELSLIKLFAPTLQRQRRHPGHLAEVLDLLAVKLPIHSGIRQANDANNHAGGIQQREADHRKQEL